MNDDLGRPRPRRVPCSACNTDHVKPYALAAAGPTQVHWAPVGAIRAVCVGSAHICDSVREAVELANASGCSVAFEFNGYQAKDEMSRVVINPGDDADKRVREWWLEAYGETPEQTMARR